MGDENDNFSNALYSETESYLGEVLGKYLEGRAKCRIFQLQIQTYQKEFAHFQEKVAESDKQRQQIEDALKNKYLAEERERKTIELKLQESNQKIRELTKKQSELDAQILKYKEELEKPKRRTTKKKSE